MRFLLVALIALAGAAYLAIRLAQMTPEQLAEHSGLEPPAAIDPRTPAGASD